MEGPSNAEGEAVLQDPAKGKKEGPSEVVGVGVSDPGEDSVGREDKSLNNSEAEGVSELGLCGDKPPDNSEAVGAPDTGQVQLNNHETVRASDPEGSVKDVVKSLDNSEAEGVSELGQDSGVGDKNAPSNSEAASASVSGLGQDDSKRESGTENSPDNEKFDKDKDESLNPEAGTTLDSPGQAEKSSNPEAALASVSGLGQDDSKRENGTENSTGNERFNKDKDESLNPEAGTTLDPPGQAEKSPNPEAALASVSGLGQDDSKRESGTENQAPTKKLFCVDDDEWADYIAAPAVNVLSFDSDNVSKGMGRGRGMGRGANLQNTSYSSEGWGKSSCDALPSWMYDKPPPRPTPPQPNWNQFKRWIGEEDGANKYHEGPGARPPAVENNFPVGQGQYQHHANPSSGQQYPAYPSYIIYPYPYGPPNPGQNGSMPYSPHPYPYPYPPPHFFPADPPPHFFPPATPEVHGRSNAMPYPYPYYSIRPNNPSRPEPAGYSRDPRINARRPSSNSPPPYIPDHSGGDDYNSSSYNSSSFPKEREPDPTPEDLRRIAQSKAKSCFKGNNRFPIRRDGDVRPNSWKNKPSPSKAFDIRQKIQNEGSTMVKLGSYPPKKKWNGSAFTTPAVQDVTADTSGDDNKSLESSPAKSTASASSLKVPQPQKSNGPKRSPETNRPTQAVPDTKTGKGKPQQPRKPKQVKVKLPIKGRKSASAKLPNTKRKRNGRKGPDPESSPSPGRPRKKRNSIMSSSSGDSNDSDDDDDTFGGCVISSITSVRPFVETPPEEPTAEHEELDIPLAALEGLKQYINRTFVPYEGKLILENPSRMKELYEVLLKTGQRYTLDYVDDSGPMEPDITGKRKRTEANYNEAKRPKHDDNIRVTRQQNTVNKIIDTVRSNVTVHITKDGVLENADMDASKREGETCQRVLNRIDPQQQQLVKEKDSIINTNLAKIKLESDAFTAPPDINVKMEGKDNPAPIHADDEVNDGFDDFVKNNLVQTMSTTLEDPLADCSSEPLVEGRTPVKVEIITPDI